MQIVINIPNWLYNAIMECKEPQYSKSLGDAVRDGTPLPKGHRDLFDKTEILRFLKCPKYENCDWKNCFDCNQSRCINLNNVNELEPLIEADTESEA